VLLDLRDQIDRLLTVALGEVDTEGVVDRRQALGEDGVDDHALDLDDLAHVLPGAV
jgi:hypothetical protein